MKLVMTLVARDAEDVIAPMLEHHLAQGVDLILVADDGSVDGTRAIVSSYSGTGRVLLAADPVEKTRSAVVSRLATAAAVTHGADWVMNADVGEFWFAADPSRTLERALEDVPRSVVTFAVPVHDLTGTPARRGSGVRRLRWRDERSAPTLWRRAGVVAATEPAAVHVGASSVSIREGSRRVSLTQRAEPPHDSRLEVLRLPWRSWEQYRSEIGRARSDAAKPRWDASDTAALDDRRNRAELLEHFYVFRHTVFDGEPVGASSDDIVADDRVVDSLAAVLASGSAVRPDLLERALDDSDDERYRSADWRAAAAVARLVIPLETAYRDDAPSLRGALQETGRRLRAVPPSAVAAASLQRGRSLVGRILRRPGEPR
ncbi:hypothetical protein ELQ90_01495 [Labedella phragmitis]|uniref:Glycosyltransferase n=1 Tax=Labedella phragmitis TaxID=2498849 RepID=A0A3S3ZSE8_9MICO|nr:glycosyltransferase family 2 protein [Labedella phragmitis]RWZ52652.1 hypothetical protein ELQ90_01495 [Labedella phragmitis]